MNATENCQVFLPVKSIITGVILIARKFVRQAIRGKMMNELFVLF
jgi:hypothetical protein